MWKARKAYRERHQFFRDNVSVVNFKRMVVPVYMYMYKCLGFSDHVECGVVLHASIIQVAAVVKIQAFFRAKAAKRDYKQLGKGTASSIHCIYMCRICVLILWTPPVVHMCQSIISLSLNVQFTAFAVCIHVG